jgi:aryl-alcohol dehydrogenase-like predicted oxidoreductase
MQDQYNLLMREEEREMLPFCLNQGVGVIPWSPLARGLLTREWSAQTKRSETDKFTKALYSQAEEANHQIVKTVKAIAEERHVDMAQIALAWLLQKEAVIAPIVGATKPQHLTDAVAAVGLKLSDEEIQRLEAPYIPRLPVAF